MVDILHLIFHYLLTFLTFKDISKFVFLINRWFWQLLLRLKPWLFGGYCFWHEKEMLIASLRMHSPVNRASIFLTKGPGLRSLWVHPNKCDPVLKILPNRMKSGDHGRRKERGYASPQLTNLGSVFRKFWDSTSVFCISSLLSASTYINASNFSSCEAHRQRFQRQSICSNSASPNSPDSAGSIPFALPSGKHLGANAPAGDAMWFECGNAMSNIILRICAVTTHHSYCKVLYWKKKLSEACRHRNWEQWVKIVHEKCYHDRHHIQLIHYWKQHRKKISVRTNYSSQTVR